MSGFLAATTFLTRFGPGAEVREPDKVAKGVVWFPIVGGLLGSALAAIFWELDHVLTPLIAATLVVAVGAWVTGAIHEDGLADCADAFGGVRTREESIRILKDPSLGTYGVSALIVSFVARIAALRALDTTAAFLVLPVAHALSRAGAIGVLGFTGTATGDGLGAAYALGVSRKQVTLTALVGFTVGLVVIGPLIGVMLAGAGLACMAVGLVAMRRIGGVTGDVLGAAQQASEIVALLIGVALMRRGLLEISWPWWSALGSN